MHESSHKELLPADHSEVDQLLTEVLTSLRIADRQGAFEMLDLFWARLAMHIRAEHLHLFPAILSTIRCGKVANKEGCPSLHSVTAVIGQLRTDHDHFMKELAGSIKRMRELIGDEQPARLSAVEKITKVLEALSARLRAHNLVEEAEIYPLIDLVFEPADIMTLNAQIKRQLQNLPPRFDGRT